MMQRHEAWRLAYRMDRYLRSAANSDIEQRSRDITLNMMNVNDTGQLSAEVPSEEAMVWWELWTHILEELSLRSVDYRTLDLMPPFPWISHPDAPRGLKILGKRQLPNKDFISRVGQREHMKAAYEHGRFRIAPATTYSDPLSIGVQSGPPIGAQKGPFCRRADRLMLGAVFALLAA